MAETVLDTHSMQQYLFFKLDSENVAIKLDNIETIQLSTEVVPIPRAPKFVLGVTNVENTIIPVINLEYFVNDKQTIDIDNAIIIVVSNEDTIFGLYSSSLPIVVTNIEEIKERSEKIPTNWQVGTFKSESIERLTLLDPAKFWISLGDTEIISPVLQIDQSLQQVKEKDSKEAKKEEKTATETKKPKEEADKKAAETKKPKEEDKKAADINEEDADSSDDDKKKSKGKKKS
ncbi:MAG: chemotaxis protein CheW [Candidatus Heimdallarchaeota archaeon]|nr:chemotaxis protein CheW [Candidatus Heimdallarchaeota archaeon]MDH5646986.1 chemotaxis protein CheW [Candidatus Heimdallarchaeota archaeon]